MTSIHDLYPLIAIEDQAVTFAPLEALRAHLDDEPTDDEGAAYRLILGVNDGSSIAISLDAWPKPRFFGPMALRYLCRARTFDWMLVVLPMDGTITHVQTMLGIEDDGGPGLFVSIRMQEGAHFSGVALTSAHHSGGWELLTAFLERTPASGLDMLLFDVNKGSITEKDADERLPPAMRAELDVLLASMPPQNHKN